MEIRVGENESLESAIKRWKRKCARSGILADARKREHYEKPSVKRKKKAEAAMKLKYYFHPALQFFQNESALMSLILKSEYV